MTLVEKLLVAVLAVGVWMLIAVTLTSSPAQAEGQELSRADVERIVEGCTVSGPADDGYLDRGRISC